MKIIKRLLSFIFLCVIIAGGVLGYKGYEEYKKALSEESVKEMAARIEEQPNYTTIDELPQTYIDAVLSVEDKRFYDHFGVDPIAVGRAFFNDIKAGAYVEGGSTITQQLAKNQYFTQDKKIVRKVAEMFMAFKIESELDKDTIFELYVNSIFFGNGYYCVADASNGYFGKVPSEMNFDECTLLAGVPNAPTNYNPTASPELARQRQKQVISMTRCGSRILLRISAVLNTIVSTNPSLDPRSDLSLSGSSTPLAGYVLQSRAIHSLYPSINRQAGPERTLRIT